MTNESELRRELEGLGSNAVRAEELTMQEQIGLFDGARVIVGASGAGLTNMGLRLTRVCGGGDQAHSVHDRVGLAPRMRARSPVRLCAGRRLRKRNHTHRRGGVIRRDSRFEYEAPV